MDPVQGVDRVFWYIFGVSALLLTGITIAMVYFVIRYRRSKHPVAADIRDNYPLEIIWTVIPTILALWMFWIGWQSYVGLRTVPDDAMEVEVLGQQYSWIFIYDNDKETENELVVPLGKPIKLNITSVDVNHAFYVPAYRIKADSVRGMYTYAWFMADEIGEFDILCTEYCGVDHAYMVATLKIIPQEEFDVWIEEEE
jgi:cytochrome c oxidase subunit 2